MNKTDLSKTIEKNNNHLKLVTYIRALLNTGSPIFITGNINTGKTKLAKEIGSYGFVEVVYVEPSGEAGEVAAIEKFKYAIDTFGNYSQLLIIDEQLYFEQSGLINLDELFYENFKGSLLVVSQLQTHIQLTPFHTHPVSYNIHIKDLVSEIDYKIIQHLAPYIPFDTTIISEISFNLTLPNPITTFEDDSLGIKQLQKKLLGREYQNLFKSLSIVSEESKE